MNVVRNPGGEYEVGLGEMMICTEPSILSISGIGSCVGLALRDTVTFASGLAHIVLPASKEANDAYANPGKYSDTAVRELVKGLVLNGAIPGQIKAKLVGGGQVLTTGGFDSSQNVESTRSELARRGVEIIAEDVGLTYGRSMRFHTGTGEIQVRRFEQCNGIARLKDTLVI